MKYHCLSIFNGVQYKVMAEAYNEELLIFVKNAEEGKVKTRLAKTVGNKNALKIYKALLNYTNKITSSLKVKKTVSYSNYIEKQDVFLTTTFSKTIQQNGDLGQKMLAAFTETFNKGAAKVVIIGSDCFELTKEHIETAFTQLQNNDVVIGPALDGGYYLLGMNKPFSFLFENKNWSTPTLLKETLADLSKHNLSHQLLPVLSDIDNYEDLKKFRSLLQLLEDDSEDD